MAVKKKTPVIVLVLLPGTAVVSGVSTIAVPAVSPTVLVGQLTGGRSTTVQVI